MHHPHVKHTIDIFERVYQNLPPLVPELVEREMAHALEHLRSDVGVGIDEVESVVISIGKKIWPYWKAFGELCDMCQGRLGEKFLLGRLPPALKQKYAEFKEHGADYHDLRSGAGAVYFTPEERQEIAAALVEVDRDMREHMRQAVLSVDSGKYQNLVIDFQNILDDIEKRLDSLRLVAEDEGEHPELAEEIQDKIKTFEFGLCLLGPRVQHHEVLNVEDHFEERRGARRGLRI
ncbi:MAG: hypothetical protein HY980_04235 [Candidatus Magasanikbacteria bacterium]|nr:hypothetical protein [Candidatus Magasanikbacteria bacterium]